MPDVSPPPLALCNGIAAAQHGILTAAQAVEAGLSPSAVRRLARSGAWKRVRPCVYALWIPTAREELWRHRLTAAALWLGDGSAASHRAATIGWELDGVDAAPIELSTTGRRRSYEPGLVVHHVKVLSPDEVVIQDGIPLTSVPRTLIDLCAVADASVVEIALESALRKRLVRSDQLRAALARSDRMPSGTAALDALLDGMPRKVTDSTLEVLLWQLIRRSTLPLPVRQHEVRDEAGRFVGRVDFAYPEARLVIEADSHTFHSGRRDWERDRARGNALLRLGWRVYRVTWNDVTTRREQVVAGVAALLADPLATAVR